MGAKAKLQRGMERNPLSGENHRVPFEDPMREGCAAAYRSATDIQLKILEWDNHVFSLFLVVFSLL